MEQANCILLARNVAKVIRNTPVASLDDVAELHRKFPRNDIGVEFAGEAWYFFPEFDDPGHYHG